MHRSSPARVPRWSALALAALLSGCGLIGGSGATPAPTPVRTPDIDTAAAFEEWLDGDALALEADFQGTYTRAGDRISLVGTYATDPDGFAVSLSLTLTGAQPTGQLYVAGRNYLRRGGGPWVVDDSTRLDSALPLFGDALSAASFEEAGVARLGMERVTRLTSDDLVLPQVMQSLGISDRTTQGMTGTFEPLVTDAGELACFDIAVTIVEGGGAGRWDVRYDVRRTGDGVAVEAPAEPWVWHRSERFGYSVAYPPDWEVEERREDQDAQTTEFDLLRSPAGEEIQVYRHAAVPVDTDPETWYADSALFLKARWQADPEVNEPVRIGDDTGRLFEFHVVDATGPHFFMEATLLHEGRGWDLDWFSTPGDEAADRALFQRLLLTFQPSA
jgi:hypothetical protein